MTKILNSKIFSGCEALLRRRAADYQWVQCQGSISREHYQNAIDWFLERTRGIEGVLGLYDLGSIRYPGLSDIDMLVVLYDGFLEFDRLRILLYESIPGRFKDVFLHDPYLIRASDVGVFFEFTPCMELNAHWRANEDLPERARSENQTDLCLYLLDIITDAYPWEFIQFLDRPVLVERELIGRLKGLGYCSDLMRRIGVPIRGEFETYSAEVQVLREYMFQQNPAARCEQLLALTQQAIGVSHRLALDAAQAVGNLWGMRIEGRMLLYCTRVASLFADPVPPEPRFGRVRLRRTDYTAQLPAAYGFMMRQYMAERGPVTDRLRRCCEDRLHVAQAPAPGVIEAMRRRARLRNSHQVWLTAMGLGLPGFMTFGYRTTLRRGDPRWLRELGGRLLDRTREVMLHRHLLRISKENR